MPTSTENDKVRREEERNRAQSEIWAARALMLECPELTYGQALRRVCDMMPLGVVLSPMPLNTPNDSPTQED